MNHAHGGRGHGSKRDSTGSSRGRQYSLQQPSDAPNNHHTETKAGRRHNRRERRQETSDSDEGANITTSNRRRKSRGRAAELDHYNTHDNSDTAVVRKSYSDADAANYSNIQQATATKTIQPYSAPQSQTLSRRLKDILVETTTRFRGMLKPTLDTLRDKAALVNDSLTQVLNDEKRSRRSNWAHGMKSIAENRKAIAPAPIHTNVVINEDFSEVMESKERDEFYAEVTKNQERGALLALPEITRSASATSETYTPPPLPPKRYHSDSYSGESKNQESGSDQAPHTAPQSVAQPSPRLSLKSDPQQASGRTTRSSIGAQSNKEDYPSVYTRSPDYTLYTSLLDYTIPAPPGVTLSPTQRVKKVVVTRRRRRRIAKICGHFKSCACANDKHSADTKAAEPEVRPSEQDNSLNDSLFTPDTLPNLMTAEQMYEMVTMVEVSGLISEYYYVTSEPHIDTFKIGKMAVHTAKNRYSDVLCYDGNRVVLAPINDDPTSDYINASHVNGYKQKFGYIACQGPLEQTTHDFWRMVWQENCRVIVMNTRVFEKGRNKCYQYWPDTLQSVVELELYTLTCSEVEFHDVYARCLIHVKNTKTSETREVYHLLFLGWPDYGLPASGTDFLNFLFVAQGLQEKAVLSMGSNWKGHPRGPPMVVHCSAGVGRSGTFICADICIYMLDDILKVNIAEVVKGIRKQRAYSIQTSEQYLFCYDIVLEYAQKRSLIPHNVNMAQMLAIG